MNKIQEPEVYNVVVDGEVVSKTLPQILEEINSNHSEDWTDYNETDWSEGMSEWTDWVLVDVRLEQLREALRDENISYGEIAELQSLAQHIHPDDVELLQWIDTPEEAQND